MNAGRKPQAWSCIHIKLSEAIYLQEFGATALSAPEPLSSAAPPKGATAGAPIEWNAFSDAPAVPFAGVSAPFDEPQSLPAPPAASGAATAAGSEWFDFGGGPPDTGDSGSTALIPAGVPFTAGGATAPAGWASFDDAAFLPPPGSQTAPAGSLAFGDPSFECVLSFGLMVSTCFSFLSRALPPQWQG